MPAKVQYKLVYGITAEFLEKEVNQHLSDGWELVGGIAISPEVPDSKDEAFVQAMVKPIKGQSGGRSGKTTSTETVN